MVEKERKKRGRGEGRVWGVEWGWGEERRGFCPKEKNGRITIATICSQLPFKKFS